MTTNKEMKISFGKFERPAAGDDCNGCEVFINGIRTQRATIKREVSWKETTLGAYYGMTVTGYTVELGDEEVEVETLAEARKVVKEYLAKQPVEQHIAECMVAWARGIRTYRTRWGTLVEG